MTKKDPKANLKPFKPGQSGNPNGRPKVAQDVLKARALTSAEFTRLVNKYLHMGRADIAEDLKRPEATMLEILVGGMVAKAAKDHDNQRVNLLLDRIIGKVKDELEIQLPRPTIIHRPSGEQVILGASLPGSTDDEIV